MQATPASNRGTVGAVAASCGWLSRTRPALSSGGVDRASLARSKPASACSAESRARKHPPLTLLVALPTARPIFVGRRPQHPAAADHSARAPRVASFLAPRRPSSTCSAPPLPLPRAKTPSADESLHADLSQRLAFASSPRVPCPGVNQCLRARAFGPFALLAYSLPPRKRGSIRNGGPPPVPRVEKPWPGFRHAFTGRLTPAC